MPTLHWRGKEAIIAHVARVPDASLLSDGSHGVADSGNLLVEGDNLIA